MSIIGIIVLLIILGVLNSLGRIVVLPIAEPFRTIIVVLLVVLAVFVVLNAFGLLGGVGTGLRFGRVGCP